MARPHDHRHHRSASAPDGVRRRPGAGVARSLVVAGAAACAIAGASAGYAVQRAARPAPAHRSGSRPTPTLSRVAAARRGVEPAQIDRGVVDIDTSAASPSGGSAGTGMVLSPGGEVLTNYHVVAGATSITATDVANGRMYPAAVVGYSRRADVAVLSLAGASGLPAVVTADSNGVRPGAAVTAFGNALGMGGLPSEAAGTVTATNQAVYASGPTGGTPEYLTGLIATSAAIQPGDSGGPLVDPAGAVIGMDTAMVTDPGAAPSVTASYAIPIDTALQTAARLTAAAGTLSQAVTPVAARLAAVPAADHPGDLR